MDSVIQWDGELAAQSKTGGRIVWDEQPERGFLSGMRDVAGGLVNELLAGTQKTSPVMSAQGAPLGRLVPTDSGSGFIDQAGKLQELDTRKHVTLIEPGTGRSMVYARTPETDEGLAAGAGRILGLGALAPAPTRLPGGLGSGAKALPEGATVTPQQLLGDFEKLNIPPSMVAVSQATGGRTPGIVSNVLKGTVGVADLQAKDINRMLAAAGRAGAGIASRYGEITQPRRLGLDIQEGIEQVAKSRPSQRDAAGNLTPEAASRAIRSPTRATSLPDKAEALYDRFWSHFGEGELIDMSRSVNALTQPGQRFHNIELGQQFVDPRLQKWADIIQGSGGKLSIQDARAFRSEIGPMLKPSLTNNISEAQLRRVYGALSEDIKAAATAKGANASFDLARADKYYSAAMDRMDRLGKLMNVQAGEAVYDKVRALARKYGSRADADLLRKVMRSMPGNERNDFAATVVRGLGRPTKGGTDPLTVDVEEFSPMRFVSEYDDLSKEAKDVLFDSTGKMELRKELDALNRIMGAEKKIEQLANFSGTGRFWQTIQIGTGLLYDPVSTLGLLGMGAAAEKLIMSPTFVRWYYRAPWSQPKNSPQWLAHIAQLRLMPIDAELRPDTEALANRLLEDQRKTAAQPSMPQ